MNLVEVVILVGAQCLSPIASGPGLTEAGKVPCAVLIRQDPATADIDIVPAAAATDPEVVAMLVKPNVIVPLPNDGPETASAAVPAGDVTGSISPAPRIVPTSAEVDGADLAPIKARPVMKRKKVETTRRHAAAARRSDVCGSSRAVWYTNREGRRKYRCAKAG